MSAKEMFEKLGYELNNDINLNQHRIEYKRFDETTRTISIVNGEHNKIIQIEDKNVRDVATTTNYNYINLEELQAINEQVRELGWYE